MRMQILLVTTTNLQLAMQVRSQLLEQAPKYSLAIGYSYTHWRQERDSLCGPAKTGASSKLRSALPMAYGALTGFSNTLSFVLSPETSNLGADTLAPGHTCMAYGCYTALGHNYEYKQLFNFRKTYLPRIASRSVWVSSQMNFANSDVYSMQEIRGFEILVRGSSPWCEDFTHNNWLNFEYARDVIHYYCAGPGNRYARTMVWL